MTQTDQRDQQEQKMEQQIQIREVTQIQASWTEQERGGPGAFSMQLILDNGVEEYIIRPTAEDADILLQLLQRSDHATFDLGRKVLMFSNLDVDVTIQRV
ncbi:MAG: hypothetical protein H0V86_13150 [Chloroflexia bacterium]|nr:hypothetical protein [Chloroflexia bacterium]